MAAVLITGGAGFIGSHIAGRFIERWDKVIVFDDMSTGKKENIPKGASFINRSICDKNAVDAALNGVDIVFHLAAKTSVPESCRYPEQTFQVNILGTLNVLWAAEKNNVQKVILASSAAVYGDDPTLPKTESMLPNPKSPYAVSKITGEYLAKWYYEQYGLETACLRYFNVYGPRQPADSSYAAVIPQFIKKAKNNDVITILGDGMQTRDFINVQDVVSANEAVMKHCHGDVFNIGCGQRVSINGLAEKIIELAGSKSKIIYAPERAGDIKHSVADISKASKFWKPKISLDAGLELLIY